MHALLVGLLAAIVLAVPSATTPPVSPGTTLTVTTWLEGGRSRAAYTLTCRPASLRGLPPGTLRPADACRAVALAGRRLFRPRLSQHIDGCAYVVAPRRALISGTHLGRRVRTTVEVGACERLLVPLAVLERFVVWRG